MALAGIELRYIVDHLSANMDGYYVNNIYGITKDSILFKLHHTIKGRPVSDGLHIRHMDHVYKDGADRGEPHAAAAAYHPAANEDYRH